MPPMVHHTVRGEAYARHARGVAPEQATVRLRYMRYAGGRYAGGRRYSAAAARHGYACQHGVPPGRESVEAAKGLPRSKTLRLTW